MKTEKTYLKNKLKTLKTSTNFVDNPEYTKLMKNLIKIDHEKANSVRIRSKYDWYKHREKSSKFFPNLEKPCTAQNQMWYILIGNIEVNNHKDINNKLYLYYKNLFNKTACIKTWHEQFFKHSF